MPNTKKKTYTVYIKGDNSYKGKIKQTRDLHIREIVTNVISLKGIKKSNKKAIYKLAKRIWTLGVYLSIK